MKDKKDEKEITNCSKYTYKFQTPIERYRIFLWTEMGVYINRNVQEIENNSSQSLRTTIELMNFQSMNPLNTWLNLVSGNLLPMTADNSSFPILWRIYSIIVWLLGLFYTVSVITSFFFVPKEKTVNEGILVLIVTIEGIFMVLRIQGQKTLVQQLIRCLNDSLRIKDKALRSIVEKNLKPMEIPFRFYLTGGLLSLSVFCTASLPLAFEKNTFFYVDYTLPGIYSKEPFSVKLFLLGSMIIMISNIYIFLKKVGVDVYTTYLVLLTTAQYQYIALRLVSIFRDDSTQDNHGSFQHDPNSKIDFSMEKKIKVLCRYHNSVVRITLMLRKLLSLNFSFIYINNVFRFCFIGVMITRISASLLEGCMIVIYGLSSTLQFYILCSCVQKLLEASTEITDKAFHEDWYRFGVSIKRTFMLFVMASNNLEVKLAMFERFNLSLPSFMTVLNQSYSFALLILRVN